jgi:serine/threonine-protein kinase
VPGAAVPRDDHKRTRLIAGQTVKGRYRVVRELGAVWPAAVYLAEELATGRQVVLKVFPPELSRDRDFGGALARVARAVGSAAAAGGRIAAVQECERTEDGDLFLVVEYAEGRSLRAVLQEEGALHLRRALHLASQIAEGLEAAHEAGMVHGGLTPDDVLLDGVGEDEGVRLQGFEAAAFRAGPAVEGLPPDRRPGAAIEYTPPEQLAGEPATTRSDVYACGIILYEMLTGSPPFTGGTPEELRAKQLRDSPVPPRALRADVPAVVQLQVLRALEKDPAKRPSRVRDLMNAELQASGLLECEAEAAEDAPGLLRRLLGPLVAAVERLEELPLRWKLSGLVLWLAVSVAAVWLLVGPRAGAPPADAPVLPARQDPVEAAATAPREPRDREAAPAVVEPEVAAGVGTPGPPPPDAAPAAAAGATEQAQTPVEPPTPPVTERAEPPARATSTPPARPAPARVTGPGPGRRTDAEGGRSRRESTSPAPAPRERDREEAVTPDGTAIIDWLFRSPR